MIFRKGHETLWVALVGWVTLVLQYVALATCGHWGGVVVSGSLWSLPLGPRAQPRSPSWKGTGVAEVVKGELPAEAYRWPFPCPGLPHHRRLPDPAESQGAARLKVACLQEPRFGREATDPRAPASRTCRSLWGSSPRGSCRTGPLPPQAVPTVPCSFLATKLWLLLHSSALGPSAQATEQGWNS